MFEKDLPILFSLLPGNRVLVDVEGWKSRTDTHERFLSRDKIRRERGIFLPAGETLRFPCARGGKAREHVWPKEILIIKNRGI